VETLLAKIGISHQNRSQEPCLSDEQVLQSEVQREAMTRLMGLQFKIVYKKGRENVVVHALSKIPNLMQIQSCSEVRPAWI
jgi:hypothetical protein